MRILSIDGGGYLGLSSAAFLAELERHFGKKCCEVFDFFCGTSTGAIIALALASGKSAREVVDLYQTLGKRVFPDRTKLVRGSRKWLRGWLWARYSQRPLKKVLDEVFGERTLQTIADRKKYALVSAFNLSRGEPRIFKTDHSPELTGHNGYRLADIALASSAAPLYFPVVELRNPTTGVLERFCDGGVFANSPAFLAYAEAVGYLRLPPSEIDILSVSSPRSSLAERKAAQDKPVNRGLIRWGGERIAKVMIDGTSAIADTALNRIAAQLREDRNGYFRVRLAAAEGLDMDVATAKATESLMQIGSEEAQQNERRHQLKRFFCEGGC